jgi:alpha-L-fucosidase
MLNIPLPASGMPDSDELNVLEGITKWMAVNSEAIYATRPWKIFGAGPQSEISKGDKGAVFDNLQFNEKNRKDFSYEDVRFTTKDKTLYTFFMGWPAASQIVIKPLAANSEHKIGTIENIELFGYGKVNFTRDDEGLKVILPAQQPCEHAFCLKINGVDLV